MFTLEDKINIAMAYIATDDKFTRKKLRSMAVEAMKSIESAPATDVSDDASANVDDLIINLLKRVGMPPHLIGYSYCVLAIKLCVEDPSYLRSVTTRLYGDIAGVYNTTPSRVERAMRHAIEVIFDRGGIEGVIDIFGNTVSPIRGKLTNAEFCACCTQEITGRMKKRERA